MKTALIMILLFSLIPNVFGQAKKVAVVKIIRGEVEILTLGKTAKLKVEDWVEDGAVVKTADKSFAKLVFIDKSQMNIGPNSEMKIEKFSDNEAGVIDLVKGKIRSQVTKDYLQIKDKDKSKLFIKTPNAVMGVRGTDFMISTNGTNTAAILFEGEVVFNKTEGAVGADSQRLESIVDQGVRINPGEFSVVEPNRPEPTVPSILNVQQKESLEKNTTFDSSRTPSSGKEEVKSVVPDGLNGQVVSNNSDALKTQVSQVGAVDPAAKNESKSAGAAEGFVSGNTLKPANGSFVHIDSGVIIPPAPGSVLDSNTNTYIPSAGSGKVSASGDYIPPKNVEITAKGEIFINNGGVVTQIEKPSPVVVPKEVGNATFASPRQPSSETGVFKQPPALPFDPKLLRQNVDPNANGGIRNINDAVQTGGSGKANVQINIGSGGP